MENQKLTCVHFVHIFLKFAFSTIAAWSTGWINLYHSGDGPTVPFSDHSLDAVLFWGFVYVLKRLRIFKVWKETDYAGMNRRKSIIFYDDWFVW